MSASKFCFDCICVFYLQLDINTVAAGGGSQLFFRSGMFVVGPESAGAHPGPVCYMKGLFVYNISYLNLQTFNKYLVQ